MDPATFAANYGYPALPPLPPGIRYPYPASTAAPTAVSSGRGMIYYPQAVSVDKPEIDVDVEGTDTDGGLDDSPRCVQDKNTLLVETHCSLCMNLDNVCIIETFISQCNYKSKLC